MKLSLKGKIALNMWMVAAISTLIAQFVTSGILIKDREKNIEHQLRNSASSLISLGISDYHGLKGFQKLEDFLDESLKIEKKRQFIFVFTSNGKLMLSTATNKNIDPNILFHHVEKPTFFTKKIDGRKHKVLVTPYKAKSGKPYFLYLATPAPQFLIIIESTLEQAMLLFIMLSLLSLLVSHFLADKITKPIRSIALHLNQMHPAQMREWKPLILPSGGYLYDIASGINNLAVRIKSSFYRTSRTNRYLSHELRNPLTILMGEAESILEKKDADKEEYRQVVHSSLEEISRINNVVSTMAQITKRERDIFKPTPLHLSNWVSDNLSRWEKILGEKIDFEKPQDTIVVMVDPDLLYRLVDNLIRNIRDHAGDSRGCKLFLSKQRAKGRLTVHDNGPGLPDLFIQNLNKDSHDDKSQLGIGLALCQEIATICNLGLFFKNRPEGGLAVSIDLETPLGLG